MLISDRAAVATDLAAEETRPRDALTPFMPDQSQPFRNAITELIERHATALFVVIGLLYLVCFNGQWRIGLDSANYRGLADGLASGRGYTFGEWAPRNVYPGYPLLLAGLQKAFGKSAVAPCVAMLVMSALTLVITYRLIRLHYPKWIAVTVTCGVATNSWFLQQSSELMTDVPFLLGVVTALYGWELLKRDVTVERRWRVGPIVLLLLGLGFAAVMRPTFYILVAAWGVTCAWGILHGPHRKFYATALGAMLVVWIAFAAVDPRSRGFHPLAGGYEREAIAMLRGIATRSNDIDALDAKKGPGVRAFEVLHDQFPAGFFGEQLSILPVRIHGKKVSWTSILGSLVVIGAAGLLIRRHMLWTMLAWGTVAVTVIVSAEPRYYVMVVPVLSLAWLTLLVAIAKRVGPRAGVAVLGVGMALVTLNNISASVAFVKEQRARNFLETYKNGKWLSTVRMAGIIQRSVSPYQTVLGPSGSVLSYLSGRHVWTQREILPRRGGVPDFPRFVRDKRIQYAIFPASLYQAKEPAIARMMERGVMTPTRWVGEVRGIRLMEMKVNVPPGDWLKLKKLKSREWRAMIQQAKKEHAVAIKQRPQNRKR